MESADFAENRFKDAYLAPRMENASSAQQDFTLLLLEGVIRMLALRRTKRDAANATSSKECSTLLRMVNVCRNAQVL